MIQQGVEIIKELKEKQANRTVKFSWDVEGGNKSDEEKSAKKTTLKLDSDIYSYTYFSFITDHNVTKLGELSLRCLLTIAL